MIIIGTTVLNFTREQGEFHCPTCAAQQSYRQKRGRQFLTLYFIPLIPLNSVGEFIQCGGCRQRFDVSILTYDPAKERAELLEMYSRLLLLVMLSTNRVTEIDRDRLQQVLFERFDQGVSEEELMQYAEEAEAVDADPLSFAHRIRRTYDPHIAADVLRAAFSMLSRGDGIGSEEKEFLVKLGQALGFTTNEMAALWDMDKSAQN